MIDEKEVLQEFQKLLEDKTNEYIEKYGTPPEHETPPNIFIQDNVWDSELRYHRMMMTTKQKFFEYLSNGEPLEKYEKDLRYLWDNIDRDYMKKAIEELRLMVMSEDFENAKITQRSIKLQNFWQEYELGEQEYYKLNPEKDFRMIEQRYVRRHIKLYENWLKRFTPEEVKGNIEGIIKQYDKMDKTIPYYDHRTEKIKCYNTISTYNSMLYNVNLLRTAWNRTAYDSRLLGNKLWYLPAHRYACPGCAYYQGYVYAERGASPEELILLNKYGHPYIHYVDQVLNDDANMGITVGHPNCKHNWSLFWSADQVQKDKYNSDEWKEKYKNKQKIQSLDLQKSRLLTDRRIYKSLDRQDLVDKTTSKIKKIREAMKELEE